MMRVKFHEFSLQKCQCACEDDKPIVFNNVANLMKATEAVPLDSSTHAALSKFDELVHGNLPDVFLPAVGNLSFAYKHLAMFCILIYGADAADELAALPKEGLGNVALILDRTWRACFQLPCVIALTELGASFNLHWSGRLKNGCWVIFITVVTLAALIAHDQALLRLAKP